MLIIFLISSCSQLLTLKSLAMMNQKLSNSNSTAVFIIFPNLFEAFAQNLIQYKMIYTLKFSVNYIQQKTYVLLMKIIKNKANNRQNIQEYNGRIPHYTVFYK